ncbi:MAG TPA: hypothetical protein VFY84_19120, partial [Jiangellales bacterium]|nr:hypothetical protein [Jiangellales bacterium]
MRKLDGALSAAAVVAGLVVAMPAAPALANSPGLPVSADALPTWQTNGVVWDLAASQGKVVAVGTFTQIRPGAGQTGTTRNLTGVAIFNAQTGQPDTCQLPAGLTGGTAQLWAAEVAPGGQTVFIGGNFSNINGVTVSRLAEINVQTCQVTSFRAGAISSFVREIKVTTDAVYFGGLFRTVAGQPRLGFAKVNRAGQLQPWIADATGNTPDNYNPTVDPNATSRGESIVVSPDGTKVALGGGYFWINGVASHSVTVVDATTGAVLRAYPGFVQNTSRTQALTSDGVNFYGGNEGSAAFDGTFAINWETLDQVWRDTCLGAVQDLEAYQGLLFHAHHNHDCASMGMFPDGRRIYMSVTHTDDPTQHHIGWFPELNDGIGEQIGPRALEFAPGTNGNTYLWVGGEFTRVNGTNQQGLTRFGPQDTGNPPVPTIAARAITPGAIQVNIRGVNDRDDEDITYAVYRGTNTTTPVWT